MLKIFSMVQHGMLNKIQHGSAWNLRMVQHGSACHSTVLVHHPALALYTIEQVNAMKKPQLRAAAKVLNVTQHKVNMEVLRQRIIDKLKSSGY
jgi:hypothetical protein